MCVGRGLTAVAHLVLFHRGCRHHCNGILRPHIVRFRRRGTNPAHAPIWLVLATKIDYYLAYLIDVLPSQHHPSLPSSSNISRAMWTNNHKKATGIRPPFSACATAQFLRSGVPATPEHIYHQAGRQHLQVRGFAVGVLETKVILQSVLHAQQL